MTTENKFFISRINELAERALGGRLACSSFLSPEEQLIAERTLKYTCPAVRYAFYGGYPEAERKILVLFPDYVGEEDFDQFGIIKAVFVKPGGYVSLTHSSYMGAVLNCGVDRACVGDIVLAEGGAVIFFLAKTADYFLSDENPLERVGRDKVTLSVAGRDLVDSLKRQYEELTFTVASCRIDCLTAEISRTSREGAKELIDRGDVRVNYETVSERSGRFGEGDVISVRGSGKYIIKELNETRKGRVRVLAYKYI